MSERWELDGEPVDLDEFIADNEFGDDEISDIYALEVGEEYRFGGGAMPITTLRRIARNARPATAFCDCCGDETPRDQIAVVIAYGIETAACCACRGLDPRLSEDEIAAAARVCPVFRHFVPR